MLRAEPAEFVFVSTLHLWHSGVR